jgi:hypothetical protein
VAVKIGQFIGKRAQVYMRVGQGGIYSFQENLQNVINDRGVEDVDWYMGG